MAVSEQDRHNLRTDLVDAIGETSTNILMNCLPPMDSSDVATKNDLLAVTTREEFLAETRKVRDWMLTGFISIAGLQIAIAGVVIAVILRIR